MIVLESHMQVLERAPENEKTIEQFHGELLLAIEETASAAESNVARAAAPFDAKTTESSTGAGGEEVEDRTVTVVDEPEYLALSDPDKFREIKKIP